MQSSGIHYIVDCTINDSDDKLSDYKKGINIIQKIIKLLKLTLVIPPVAIQFPLKDDDNLVPELDKIKLTNKKDHYLSNSYQIKENEDTGGYTIFGVISESHISIHTFPENNYFALDLYSCKMIKTDVLDDFLKAEFSIKNINQKTIIRQLNDNWFYEKAGGVPDLVFGYQKSKVLVDKYSKFQHIELFESQQWGKVLVLDGVLQITEKDYFAYNEMMAHIPIYAHHNPHSVFIIGGGDGCILNEVTKHESLKNITICEIDQDVIDISKEYFPFWSQGWNDPRVKSVTQDANLYIKTIPSKSLSCIIMDSSDYYEDTPSAVLYKNEFFTEVDRVLTDDGIYCFQGESIHFDKKEIKQFMTDLQKFFPICCYGNMTTPTYPGGQIGIIICSKKYNPKILNKNRPIIKNLKHYNFAYHEASFVLPNSHKLV
ncbi:Spermine/spermidine synthase domain [seawater metagenome]|uniref:Spermine/spermidine synthase domain n=1 Tax=seawater metagenome TaxID=1561972 RepID=A0A5E8CM29_9ZZZZ